VSFATSFLVARFEHQSYITDLLVKLASLSGRRRIPPLLGPSHIHSKWGLDTTGGHSKRLGIVGRRRGEEGGREEGREEWREGEKRNLGVYQRTKVNTCIVHLL